MNEHLGCFQFFATTNNAAMNIVVGGIPDGLQDRSIALYVPTSVLALFVYISSLNHPKVGFPIPILELWKLRLRGKWLASGHPAVLGQSQGSVLGLSGSATPAVTSENREFWEKHCNHFHLPHCLKTAEDLRWGPHSEKLFNYLSPREVISDEFNWFQSPGAVLKRHKSRSHS